MQSSDIRPLTLGMPSVFINNSITPNSETQYFGSHLVKTKLRLEVWGSDTYNNFNWNHNPKLSLHCKYYYESQKPNYSLYLRIHKNLIS